MMHIMKLWKRRKKKNQRLQVLKEKYELDMVTMREEMENKFQQILAKIDTVKSNLNSDIGTQTSYMALFS